MARLVWLRDGVWSGVDVIDRGVGSVQTPVCSQGISDEWCSLASSGETASHSTWDSQSRISTYSIPPEAVLDFLIAGFKCSHFFFSLPGNIRRCMMVEVERKRYLRALPPNLLRHCTRQTQVFTFPLLAIQHLTKSYGTLPEVYLDCAGVICTCMACLVPCRQI